MKIIIEYWYASEECCSDIVVAVEGEYEEKVEYDIEIAMIEYINNQKIKEIFGLDLIDFINSYDDKYFKKNLWADKKNYILNNNLYYTYNMPKVLELNDWFEYKRKDK